MKMVLIVIVSFLSCYYFGQNNDSINQIDADGKKTGFWIITGSMRNLPEYCDTCVVEMGEFIRSRKTGLWTKFYPNGNVKSRIEFKMGKAYGYYILYLENGEIEEEGNWLSGYRSECSFRTYGRSVDGSSSDFSISKSSESLDSIPPVKNDSTNCSGNAGDGYFKCYNENKNILMDGEFKGDTLYNGKYYVYDEYGLLERVEIYKEGTYVGNAVIE